MSTRSSPKRKANARRVSTGAGCCQQCNRSCSYGHKCPECNQVFHTICMLSLNNGDNRVCIKCFEREKMDVEKLDKHDHAPFSPGNMVPFHPFTKKYAQRNNLLDEESVVKKKVAKKKVGGKKKQPTKRKLDLGAAASAEPKKSKEGEDDGQTSEEDDGVTLHNAVFKTAEVVQLEADESYQEMLKQTVKQRKQHSKDKHFKELRAVIRSSAAAARQAYALVVKAQTDTSSIKDFLKVLN